MILSLGFAVFLFYIKTGATIEKVKNFNKTQKNITVPLQDVFKIRGLSCLCLKQRRLFRFVP